MKESVKELVNDCGRLISEINLENTEVYCEYLAQTYFFATHTVRLLSYAASKMRDSDRAFQKRFIEHCQEEADHDLILIADLKKFNKEITDFEELPEIGLMWQSQYHLIDEDPLIFMGYIIALEEIAANFGTAACEKVKSFHGKGYQFLKVHGEEDVDHIEHAYNVISQLDDVRKKKILKNAEQTFFAYNSMVFSLARASIRNNEAA